MKSFPFLFLLFINIASLFSQQTFTSEDFNSSSLPQGWTTNSISGTQAWQFGIDGSAGQNGQNNIDGTAMAFFDDDALGSSSTNNTAVLNSPIFDNTVPVRTVLEFDYNFRSAGVGDSLLVEVFDGSNWIQVFEQSDDSCGNWLNCGAFHTTARLYRVG